MTSPLPTNLIQFRCSKPFRLKVVSDEINPPPTLSPTPFPLKISNSVVNIEERDKRCLEMLPFHQWENQKRGKTIRLKKTPIGDA